jgi:hypothetical protein
MKKLFKRINNSNYEAAHNGQSVWHATVRRVSVVDEKVPVTWADLVDRNAIPVFFRDTPLGCAEMEAFKAKDVKYVVVAAAHKGKPDKRRYKEPNRLAVVEFDDLSDAHHIDQNKNGLEHVLMCRLVRYAA